ncbi:hypothetical protein GCM10009565_42690 [Amycolatopsis albidoflavus]
MLKPPLGCDPIAAVSSSWLWRELSRHGEANGFTITGRSVMLMLGEPVDPSLSEEKRDGPRRIDHVNGGQDDGGRPAGCCNGASQAKQRACLVSG